MSEHDLASLLRDYVGRDEPPPPLTGPAVQRGRRIRRRRRWLAGAGTLGLVAVVGSASMLFAGDPDQTRTTAVDRTARALADYDADRMPELMDEHTRSVLARTADPGPSTFVAYDSQFNELPERLWDKASQLQVRYGSQAHSWEVAILHSRGMAEGDPEKVCSRDVERGLKLSCTVQRSDDGDPVVTSVTAARPERVGGGAPDMWMVVKRNELGTAELGQLWLIRNVTVIKSDTLITYVTERVKATSSDPADAPFTTPVDDLIAIGTDPVMVMPHPPPGANGCPAWSLHQERISCSTIKQSQASTGE